MTKKIVKPVVEEAAHESYVPEAPPPEVVPAPGTKRFRTAPGRIIAHGGKHYRADANGLIDLPIDETWYADLVSAQILKPI